MAKVEINIHAFFQRHTNNKSQIFVNGDNIRMCLKELFINYPELKEALFVENESFHSYVKVFKNDKLIESDIFENKLIDGDKLYFLVMLKGG